MTGRYFILGPAICLAAISLAACTSHDVQAATAAAAASDAFQAGDLATASAQIGKALGARDDVSDYWLLSGRIALADHNFGGAFTAFESAASLDHGNVEALTRLCQLATASNQPERAVRYADELAALHPGDPAATNVQAGLALQNGDRVKANQLVDQLLKNDPGDASALLTRSRLLSGQENYAAAAKVAEASLAAAGDPLGRLQVLREAYLKAGDAAGYRHTMLRLAQADPRSATMRLDLARILYATGDDAGAFAATRAALALKPGDVTTASAVLHLWLAQGAAAMPIAAIVQNASNGVPETRAAFAAYANALNRPDLALKALGDAGAIGLPGIVVNNAKVARANAGALLGRRDAASVEVAAVLAADPDQPRALALRGTLRAEAGDKRGAVEDLRHAIAADSFDANARLALAGLQLANGDAVLATGTLQAGLDNPGADPRLATRLATLLRSQRRGGDATAVITNYVRINPFTPRPPG